MPRPATLIVVWMLVVVVVARYQQLVVWVRVAVVVVCYCSPNVSTDTVPALWEAHVHKALLLYCVVPIRECLRPGLGDNSLSQQFVLLEFAGNRKQQLFTLFHAVPDYEMLYCHGCFASVHICVASVHICICMPPM